MALAIDPVAPVILYAGTDGGGVFRSMDGGGNWSEINAALTNTTVHVLAMTRPAPATLYAGTNGGVFVIQLGAKALPAADPARP